MAAHHSAEYSSLSAEDIRPPSTSWDPSLWADTFDSSSNLNDQVQEKYAKEIKTLKEETRTMLTTTTKAVVDKLVLIDTLERLGVAYHFENEIEEQLQQMYNHLQSDHVDYYNHDEDYYSDQLFVTALQFRLFRQHRHSVSCSVFDKFMDKDEKFKDTLIGDVKGLLSLYEATQARVHGESILDEAADFTKYHLDRVVSQLESPLKDQVKRALQHSVHRSTPRVETLHYIHTYELMDLDANNKMLLKLAKLDFKYLQNLYKKEIYELLRWSDHLDLKSKLPYTRDRMVECYLWGMAHQFEPQYSYGRIAMAKTVKMMAAMDDTYDNYATLQEAQLFTDILQRWDVNEIDSLPDYMKILYRYILSQYQNFEPGAAKHGKEFVISYAIETVKQVSRAYFKEMKWFLGGEKPTFDEYASHVMVPISGIYLLLSMAAAGLKSVSKETMDWLVAEPNKMSNAAGKIGRYLNDLASYEREHENGQMTMAVDCFMKQHSVSKEEITRKFLDLVDDEWKNLNTEWVQADSSKLPKEFLVLFLNFARAAEITYINSVDAFTSPESSFAPLIQALFIDDLAIII